MNKTKEGYYFADEATDGGDFDDSKDPLVMTTTNDLVMKLGQMLVELINKDKIMDALSQKIKTMGEARLALAGEVDKLKLSLPEKDSDLKKRQEEIDNLSRQISTQNKDYHNAKMETDKAHQSAKKATDEAHKAQLIAKGLDIAKLETFVNDQEIRNRDVVDTMQDKILTLELEIQSLKDHKTASNGASHVIPDKPTHKKQGKKYTKKAAKTTASA